MRPADPELTDPERTLNGPRADLVRASRGPRADPTWIPIGPQTDPKRTLGHQNLLRDAVTYTKIYSHDLKIDAKLKLLPSLRE